MSAAFSVASVPLVEREIEVRRGGKTFRQRRKVRLLPEGAVQKREKKEEEELAARRAPGTDSPVYQHFLPSEAEYKSLMTGSENSRATALLKYTERTFWREISGVESRATHEFARSFTASSAHGYDMEDLAQEAFLVMFRALKEGKIDKYEREYFPSYVGKIFRNMASSLSKKMRASGKFAEARTDVGELPEERLGTDISAEESYLKNLDDSINRGKVETDIHDAEREISGWLERDPSLRPILRGMLERTGQLAVAKETGTTRAAVSYRMKSLSKRLASWLRKRGYEGDDMTLAKNFMSDWRELRGLGKATLVPVSVSTDGKGRIMLKAKTYAVGEKSEKTGMIKVAPGKWELPKGEKPGREEERKPKKSEKPSDAEMADARAGFVESVKSMIGSALRMAGASGAKGSKWLVDAITAATAGRGGAEAMPGAAGEAGAEVKRKSAEARGKAEREKMIRTALSARKSDRVAKAISDIMEETD